MSKIKRHLSYVLLFVSTICLLTSIYIHFAYDYESFFIDNPIFISLDKSAFYYFFIGYGLYMTYLYDPSGIRGVKYYLILYPVISWVTLYIRGIVFYGSYASALSDVLYIIAAILTSFSVYMILKTTSKKLKTGFGLLYTILSMLLVFIFFINAGILPIV